MIKISERRQCRRSSVFVVNLNKFHTFFSVSIVVLGHVNVCWEVSFRNESVVSVKSFRGGFTECVFIKKPGIQCFCRISH